MKPAVSVIIPTYNRARFLGEAVASVRAQTFSDWELIVVDDGSTDPTAQAARHLPEVRYFRLEENSGVSRARNFGARQARGRWICFLDSDDLWLEDKLHAQVNWMQAHPDSRICYTDEIWIRRGVRVNPMKKHRKYSGNIFRHCLPLCIVSPSSVMMQSALFREAGEFDEHLPACEDYDLWLKIALHHPVHFIDRKLIVKRGGHEDQLSRKYWGMDRFRVHALDNLLKDPALTGEALRQTLETAIGKCDVLVKGFLKRGKLEEAAHYQSLMAKYSDRLKTCTEVQGPMDMAARGFHGN